MHFHRAAATAIMLATASPAMLVGVHQPMVVSEPRLLPTRRHAHRLMGGGRYRGSAEAWRSRRRPCKKHKKCRRLKAWVSG